MGLKILVKSMTGYGRFEGVFGNKRVMAEIRSVNHRYAEYNIRIPRYYGFLEEKVRGVVSDCISRGKVDVTIIMESYGDTDKQVVLNEPLAENYIESLRYLREKLKLADDISVSTVAHFSDIFLVERKEEDAEEIWQAVLAALRPALEQFMAMRKREGARLYEDLKSRSKVLLEMVKAIEQRSPECVFEYRQKLEARLREMLEGANIDESRLLTEAAIFADKIAVNEETVRIKSHLAELESVLDAEEPAGRKLDFVIQELNREINTISSKANDLTVAKMVIAFKAELEKMREQVQNIE